MTTQSTRPPSEAPSAKPADASPRNAEPPEVPMWRRKLRPYILSIPAVVIVVGILYPFLLSVVLIGVGFYIRSKVSESPVFAELKERRTESNTPIRTLFKKHPKQVVLAALSFIGTNGNGYMVIGGFIVAYATKTYGLGKTELLIATLASAVTWGVFTMIGAYWSDRRGRTTVMNVGNLAMILFAVPFFLLIDTGNLGWIYVAMILFSVGLGLSYGPQPALFAELFPASIRYSGASISYAVGTIFGGAFAPTVAQWLLGKTGGTLAISIYLALLAAVSFVATMLIKDRSGRDLMV